MTHKPFPRAQSAFVLAAALALGCVSSLSIARADDDGSTSGPPPAVARMSAVEGDVGVKHNGGTDQVAGAINAPLQGGDYVATGADGRTEIQLDAGNVVRAGSDTQLRFTQLDGAQDTVQLAQGTVELRVLQADQDHVSLQTPSVDVVPDEAGSYLVTVDSDGQTFVTTRSGSLDVTTPKGSQTLDPGHTMQITGSADNPQYQFIDTIASTDFDQWADGRDQQLADATTDPNVNQNMIGEQDLDAYGQWTNVSGYGAVWQPNNVAPDWTPYTNGNWSYQNYYGWTWVAAEPWGWAPYHYGRWAYLSSGWGWVPGRRDIAPVYSPALVAFVGFGSGGGVGVGFNFGNVGWVPLAPGEAYHSDFHNYRNFNHGFVGMPVTGWQHGNFNQITRLHTTQYQNMRAIAGRLPLNPTAANYRYTNRSIGTSVRTNSTRFNAIRPIGTVNPGPARMTTTSNGWQHFNATRTSAAATNASSGSTWQRFGNASSRANAYSSARQPQSQYQRQSYQSTQRQPYQQSQYQRQSYQSTYQRQPYQRQPYQQSPYQRQSYQSTYQRQPQQQYQQRQQYQSSRQPQASYQRSSYQRQGYQQRPSGVSQQRAPAPRGSGHPHPHGPGTM
jgi:hypothetical protein